MRVAKIRESLQLLRRNGVPINSIIDVGIQHSTPPLMEVFHDKHHFLFEPVSEYFPHIRKNYADISHDLIEAAVSDFDGELSLVTEKKTRGDEVSHSYLTETPSSASRQVRSLSLDSFFAESNHNGPYLLKIDVEGPEVPSQILKGAQHILNQVSIVMIEMTVDKFLDRAKLLHDAGFDVWDVCDLCYYGDCLWQVDCVFVRKTIKEQIPAMRPMHEKPFRPESWQSGF